MSRLPVEYYFSFRSPYSYLSAPRAFELPKLYDVGLVWKAVRPMAMRGQPLPRSKQFYILRDAAREARRLGLPFGKIYDPLGEGVWRCLCVAELASERGLLAGFVIAAATAIWGQGIDVRQDKLLRPICEQSGLDWESSVAAIDNANYRQRIEDNTARLATLGHWGVPTFSFQNKLYWGQDRIEDLERALSGAGLRHHHEVTA